MNYNLEVNNTSRITLTKMILRIIFRLAILSKLFYSKFIVINVTAHLIIHVTNTIMCGSQAILKKTNYKRPSIEGRTIQFSTDNYSGGSITDKSYAGRRSDSVTRNEDVKRSKDYKNKLNHQLSCRATRTEIIPGVMLEGSSYDL